MRTSIRLRSVASLAAIAVVCAFLVTACGGGTEEQAAPPASTSVVEPAPDTSPPQADVCSNEDGVLSEDSFVFVVSPSSGERVTSSFTVTGCSNTFESTIGWRLLARDGSELASGTTEGGTLDQPGPFTFTVEYSLDTRQVGNLEVFMPPVTEEGFPPPKDVVPLVLEP